MLAKNRSRKSARKAAVKANQRIIEGGASGKSELSRLKARTLGAYHSFVGAQKSFLDSMDDEMQAAEIKEARDGLDAAFEGYAKRIAELITHCVDAGKYEEQETASWEYRQAEAMHQDARRQYRTHLSDTRSTGTRHSGSTVGRDVMADVGIRTDLEAGGRGDVVAEPAGGEDEARRDITDDHTPTPRDDVGDVERMSRTISEVSLHEPRKCEDRGEKHESREYVERELRKSDTTERLESARAVKNPAHSSPINQLGVDMWKQLNRVSIPTFSGDKRQYSSWKAAFYTCVDAAPATPEYKLLQLRNYLRGDALKTIEGLGHSSVAYVAAKDRLERKFGGERRLVALRLDDLDNFRQMREGTAKEVERFADILDLLVINLKETGQTQELGSGSLYMKALRKMTETMISNYKRWLSEKRHEQSIESLRTWLNQEAEYRIEAAETLRGLGGRYTPAPTFYGNDLQGKSRKSKKTSCVLCSKSHAIRDCDEFLDMDIDARWSIARGKWLCFRCLASDHKGADCPGSTECGTDGCRKTHSPLLHGALQTPPDTNNEGEEDGEASEDDYSCTALADGTNEISLRTIPITVRNGKESQVINALLDDGSMRTYVNTDVAAHLQLLTGDCDKVTVGTMGGGSRTFLSETVTFVIESLDKKTCQSITATTTTRVTGEMKAVHWRKVATDWEHLKKVKFPKSPKRKTVDLLIGMDNADLHRSIREIYGKPGDPIARLTPLGWTCVGKTKETIDKALHSSNLSCFVNGGIAQINRTLERFWEIEEPGYASQTQCMSSEDQDTYETVRQSMKRSEEFPDKYQVCMPWKSDTTFISSNIEAAQKRLECTERSLRKRNLEKPYDNVIQQYLEKGYIRKVDRDEQSGRWYLPHFPISRPDKVTTKTRIVFDASARHKGICLNDFIHKGPKLQLELTDVLLRFRKSPVAIVCDVAEMYLQIELKKEDRPFHRFLWRNMEDREADEYEFNRLVFGVNSCPFQAQLVTQRHAELAKDRLPLAADSVLKSTYMDDTLDSVPDVPTAIELYQQLSSLWRSAGMHARKWVSNSEEVISKIPEEDRATEINLNNEQMPIVKTLGITWKSAEDAFTFTTLDREFPQIHTKRSFLSSIASLFDPMGMLAPFVIRAKVLMQEIWLTGLDWDEKFPEEICKKVDTWFTELAGVGRILVPRCLSPSQTIVDSSLHIFSDASADAYAAVAYLRTVSNTNIVTLRQVTSKSKVAPLKAISIPRLELLGAVLSSRIAPNIAKTLELNKESIYYWADSKNVLWWISRRSRSLKTFVANRVAQIQEVSNSAQWRYVSTKENPSDLSTRGMKLDDLISSRLWWEGPVFLTEDPSTWPKNIAEAPSKDAKEEERNKNSMTFLIRNLQPDNESRLQPERFSTLRRLIRITAWVTRFTDNCRKTEDERQTGELTVDELSDSEDSLIMMLQSNSFQTEIDALRKDKPIASNSDLIGLRPFIDDDGLLRANTRLTHADYLSYSVKHPIILPRRAWVTKLMVRSYHEQDGHDMGTNHTLSVLSERFWIMKAREEIREVERECNLCIRRKAKAATQVMAPLPKCRLALPLQAFSRTAVDYAGPFEAIQGRGRKRAKRYLCLFTCMASRAVHLEMAFSLDTDSFLNAFYRMTNRRGKPVEVLSDNGTNFVGGERELRELVLALDKNRITKSTADKGIKWTFNPPLAPHFGGVHETMIKSAKKAIYAVLGNADINDEELMTAFTGAEDLLNSRPITYQTANPKDDLPLTPNNFLHGRIGGEFAPPSVDTTGFNARQRWRRVQELVRHFWTRWIREWLPSIARRSKWHKDTENVTVGDLVLILTPDTPRGQWPMGRIVETFPGKDGKVRTARVRFRGTTLLRPIVKLCPLEFAG